MNIIRLFTENCISFSLPCNKNKVQAMIKYLFPLIEADIDCYAYNNTSKMWNKRRSVRGEVFLPAALALRLSMDNLSNAKQAESKLKAASLQLHLVCLYMSASGYSSRQKLPGIHSFPSYTQTHQPPGLYLLL